MLRTLNNQYIYIYIDKQKPHVRGYEIVPCSAFLEILFIYLFFFIQDRIFTLV